MTRLICALTLLLSPSVASAFCRTTTAPQLDVAACARDGDVLAWPCDHVGLHLLRDASPSAVSAEQFRRAVEDSIHAWGAASCGPTADAGPSFNLALLGDTLGAPGYVEGGPNENTVGVRSTWNDDPFHPADAVAVTVVSFHLRTGAILDADTELNGAFPFGLDGDREGVDLRAVLTHELGHTLGLAHSPERGAVMWYADMPKSLRHELDADDVAGVCAAYPPGREARCEPAPQAGALAHGGASCAAGGRRSAQGSKSFLMLAAGLLGRRRRGTRGA